MPIYEYQCKSCGHIFDALQKLADQPLTDCPGCGRPELQKLLSAPAFQVKGAAGAATTTRTRVGHNLDGGHSHSHDHGHSHGPHTHTHGGGGGCGSGGCGHSH